MTDKVSVKTHARYPAITAAAARDKLSADSAAAVERSVADPKGFYSDDQQVETRNLIEWHRQEIEKLDRTVRVV